jgi:hypothetical protein
MRPRVELSIESLVLHGFARDEAPRIAAALAAALEERLSAAPLVVPPSAARLATAPMRLAHGAGGRTAGTAAGRAVADALTGSGAGEGGKR